MNHSRPSLQAFIPCFNVFALVPVPVGVKKYMHVDRRVHSNKDAGNMTPEHYEK